ncbi:MAG TPA: helix-turn-helix transcriptional regulator [Arsenophonus apicola]|uniref:helix-turn-helix transcriptional regulator n=1 Tax=Arsenophonus TaxID=637 RepID=UPI0015D7359D|nr:MULTISPECIES: helix-turn-helix transcriptional regulator [Arsenophonus]UBX30877.1 helix-turn-helix transcriptional regulator [Arsenophonus apicola]
MSFKNSNNEQYEVTNDLELMPKLSKRELQILVMTCSGFTRTDIALALNVSLDTINSHFKNALRKYDLNTYNQLQAMFLFNFLKKLNK